MRKYFLCAIALALLAGCGGRPGAADGEDPRAVIERAIKAAGGEDRLARVTAGRSKGRGTVAVGGQIVPMTVETVFQVPDKFRQVQQVEVRGGTVVVTQTVAGSKGWMSVQGEVQPLEGDLLRSFREECYASQVETLVPLLREGGYTLSMLSYVELGGRRVVGVRVAAAGHNDIDLYFDRDSYLPVRTDRPIVDADTLKEVASEVVYSDIRETDGLKWPGRMVVNQRGRKVMEVVITEFKRLDKVDPRVFARPE